MSLKYNYLIDVDVIINGRIFNSDNYSISFNIKRKSTGINVAKVSIEYLSKETRDYILSQKMQEITIVAGYKQSGKGTIFYGIIDTVKTTFNDGVELELTEGSMELSTEIVNKTYAPNTSLKEIVKNIMTSSSFGMGVIDCEDFTFTRGVTLIGTLQEVLENLAVTVNAELKVDKNIIYFVKKGYFEQETEISSNTGLKKITQKDEDYILEMYLNNAVQEQMTLKVIRSNGEKLDLIVLTVSHKYSRNRFETIVECMKMLEEESNE